MLDDVLDKEAGAKPKLILHSGGVGSGIRHLSQVELDAYMNGRLPAARLGPCSAHLDSCDACRAELEDLRAFKNSAVGLSQSGSLGRELDRRKRQRQLKAVGSAAMVVGVVAAIAAVGWWQFGKARAQRLAQSHVAKQSAMPPSAAIAPAAESPHAAAQPTSAPAAPMPKSPLAATQPSAAQPNSAPAAPMPKSPRAVSQPVAAQPTSVPAGPRPTSSRVASQPVAALAKSPAAAAPSASFTLLGPFGDEITDARPEFAWQPLAGATKYSVIIVDEGLRPVQHSHGVKTTSWRPRRPLRRGRTYLWQVTATLRNGTKIVALSPTSSEARIHIVTTP